MKINPQALFLIATVFLLSTACNSPESQQKTEGELIEVSHQLGQTSMISRPEKIVVLDIGALETLHELGIKPVAVPKRFMPDYLDEIKNDESVADVGSVIEPNFEGISAMNPDLILISTRQERYYSELSTIAPTVFIGVDTKDYLNSFVENTKLLAKIVGKEELAEERLEKVQAKIQFAQEKFKDDPRKGLFIIYNNGRFSAFGKSSRFGFIHDVLHIKPAIEGMKESVHGQTLSNELIAVANPDYLFIVDRNAVVLDRETAKNDIENVMIKETNAFKTDHVFYLDPSIWFISGGGLTSIELMVDDVLRMLN